MEQRDDDQGEKETTATRPEPLGTRSLQATGTSTPPSSGGTTGRTPMANDPAEAGYPGSDAPGGWSIHCWQRPSRLCGDLRAEHLSLSQPPARTTLAETDATPHRRATNELG